MNHSRQTDGTSIASNNISISPEPLGRPAPRFCRRRLAKPIIVKLSQVTYDVNPADHQVSEKYSADARLNTSNAIKFKTVVVASPINPIVLNAFMFAPLAPLGRLLGDGEHPHET